MVRFRDILSQDNELFPNFEMIVNGAKDNFLRGLGKNDYYHSKSVEEILDNLVPSYLKKDQTTFDLAEIFILLVSVYLHDVGRKHGAERHEFSSYNEIRENHESYYLIDFPIADAISQVCVAHAPESEWPLSKCDRSFGAIGFSRTSKPFNLQRLGALLRIADELDNAYLRNKGLMSESGSIRNLIRDIRPDHTKGIIQIQGYPKSYSDLRKINEMNARTTERILEAGPYLKDIGLDYYKIWLDPGELPFHFTDTTTDKESEDFLEDISLLFEESFDNFELFPKFKKNIELSASCESQAFNLKTKFGILAKLKLTFKEIEEFYSVLSHLINSEADGQTINKGIIIYRKFEGADWPEETEKDNISIISFDDYLFKNYNLINLVGLFVEEYEKDEVYKKQTFIDPYIHIEGQEEISKSIGVIEEWLEKKNAPLLTVLGEFGAGKTTLTKKIVYDVSIKILENMQGERIPIFFSLQHFSGYKSIETTITNYLSEKLKIDISYPVFKILNKTGKLIVVLDGFDEISGLYTDNQIVSAFRLLDKMVEPKSKIILTCRTPFFKTEHQFHKLHHTSTTLYDTVSKRYGYSTGFLQPFRREQIEEYIKSQDATNALKYKEIIKKIYNIEDLATRPVLLYLIVKTLPELEKLDISKINIAKLYELFINYWIERDDGRSVLSKSERRLIAHSIAEYFLLNKISNIHYTKITASISAWDNNDKTHSKDVLSYEIRTCNFLKSDPRGNYYFVHKSFQEYFLAFIYCEKLFSIESNIDIEWYLPFEKKFLKPQKDAIVVSDEVEHFVKNIFPTRLKQVDRKEFIDRSMSNSRRNIVVLYLTEYSNFHDVFSDEEYSVLSIYSLLNESISSGFAKKCAKQIVFSEKYQDNLDLLFNLLKKSIDTIADYAYINSVLYYLKHVTQDDPFDEIEKIQRHFNKIEEEEIANILNDIKYSEEYPYTIQKRDERLRKAKRDIEYFDLEMPVFTILKDWYGKKVKFDFKLFQSSTEGITREEQKYENINRLLKRFETTFQSIAKSNDKEEFENYDKLKKRNDGF